MKLRALAAAGALAFAAALAAPPARAQDDAGSTPAGSIRVDFATYGADCGQKEENATAAVRQLCDGQVRCEVALGAALLGDPAPACEEELTVQWSCSGTLPGRNRIEVMPDAGSATLACAAQDGSPPEDAADTIDPALAEAAPGQIAADAPPGAARLQVDAATYGGNCGAPEGNATRQLAEACDGRDACSYVIDRNILGDPAPACAKDLAVQWSCTGEAAAARTATAPAEAGLGSVITLTCAAEPAQTAAAAPPPARPCDGTFNGTWATNLGSIDLAMQGQAVTGSYPGGGAIEGTAQDGVLDGRWRDASGAGTLRFTLAADGRRFTGTWTRQDGGRGTWHGSCVTPATAAADAAAEEGPIAAFAWMGADADMVGPQGQGPDGTADGLFRIQLDIGYPAQEIRAISVRSSDAMGGVFGEAAWDTADPQRPFLGVVFGGKPLRQVHGPSLGGFQGTFPLDLYAAGPGGLEMGQHVAVEITLGDGRLYRRVTQLPGSAATSPVAAANEGALVEPDTDRPGGDFADFAMDQPEPMLCRAACIAAPGCRAWTYVKPGVSGAQAHCWLKSSVAEPLSRDCCVSGLVEAQ